MAPASQDLPGLLSRLSRARGLLGTAPCPGQSSAGLISHRDEAGGSDLEFGMDLGLGGRGL